MANTYVNATVDLTTTNVTTLYTCAALTTSIAKSIIVSEDSGNADTITITLTDTDDAVFSLFKTKSITLTNGSGAVFSLFKTKAISSNATLELLTAPLVLQAGDILKVTAATADRLHVVASILEIT